jgi:NAD(P)-dependent dehydrogenase (short-subunit alcohol dehydrogenase family)
MQIDSSISALVTGGASGLGEATARMLRSKGAKVAILDMQEEKGRKVAAEIGAFFHVCDVTSEASVDAALAAARPALARAEMELSICMRSGLFWMGWPWFSRGGGRCKSRLPLLPAGEAVTRNA